MAYQSDLTNCPNCHGRGEVRHECPSCNGSGRTYCSELCDEGIAHKLHGDVVCHHCGGSGREHCDGCAGRGFEWWECDTCDHTGKITIEKLAVIKRNLEIEAQKRVEEDKLKAQQRAFQREQEERQQREHQQQIQIIEQRLAKEKQKAEDEKSQEVQRERIARGVCKLCGTCLSLADKLARRTQHSHCSVFKMPTPINESNFSAYCRRCKNKVPIYFASRVFDSNKGPGQFAKNLLHCMDCGFEWEGDYEHRM